MAIVATGRWLCRVVRLIDGRTTVNRTSRAGAISVVLLVWLVAAILSHKRAVAEANVEDIDFKRFTSNPPPIHALIAEHASVAAQTANEYWFIRWRRDGFLARKSTSYAAATTPFVPGNNVWTAGRCGDQWWSIETYLRDVAVRRWRDTGDPEQITNYVKTTVAGIKGAVVDPILTMGLNLVPAGSIAWHGDSFSYTNESAAKIVTGALSYRKPDTVSSMLVTYAPTHGPAVAVKWRIDYGYNDSSFAKRIPQTISRFLYKPKEQTYVPIDRLTILTLEWERTPLADTYLLPDCLLTEKSTVVPFVISNRAEYYLEGTNWTAMVDPNDPNIYRPAHVKRSRLFYLTFAVAILLVPAIILTRAMRKRPTQG
jgi:hypothetical protein